MFESSDRPQWRGQRPFFEIYFAVLLDEGRRRALWVRQTLFVPAAGEGRATVWGAWFDADADADAVPKARAAKRFAPLERVQTGAGEPWIAIDECRFSRGGVAGGVEGLSWDARWRGGEPSGFALPAWLPAPTHARTLLHGAEFEAAVTVEGRAVALRGRALAMHLWGRRRVPELQWVWAPWLGDASLEVTAARAHDALPLGLATLTLGGTRARTEIPKAATYPQGLVTATAAGPRRRALARAWAEPGETVGYAYRDTDGRDLLVAQSDVGSAHFEVFSRKAPGAPWRLTEERRSAGGVAVEIHQREPVSGVDYLGWEAAGPLRSGSQTTTARDEQGGERIDWPEPGAIVALGLTYADHAEETGQRVDPSAPPIAFAQHPRALLRGDGAVTVPAGEALLAALAELEPGLDEVIRRRMPRVPAVMDYEGELALVALGAIDEARLRDGVPQPLGLAACNDLTARICQVFGEGRPNPYDYWAVAKSFPGFVPAAARVWAPPGGLARMPEVTVVTRVNGEERQRGSTRRLIYDLPAMVRAASACLGRPLARGDVVLTGTPAGIGMRMSRLQRRLATLVKDRFRKAELLVSSYATSATLLRPGDVVEVDAGPAGRVRTRLAV